MRGLCRTIPCPRAGLIKNEELHTVGGSVREGRAHGWLEGQGRFSPVLLRLQCVWESLEGLLTCTSWFRSSGVGPETLHFPSVSGRCRQPQTPFQGARGFWQHSYKYLPRRQEEGGQNQWANIREPLQKGALFAQHLRNPRFVSKACFCASWPHVPIIRVYNWTAKEG